MSDDGEFASLVTALRESGATVAELGVGDFQGYGRGLCARVAQEAGAELARIPLKHCLTNRPEDAPKRLRPLLADAFGPGFGGGSLPLCVRLWSEWSSPSSPVFAAWLPLLRGCLTGESPTLCWDCAAAERCGPLARVQGLLEVAEKQRAVLFQQLGELARRFPDKLGKAPEEHDVAWMHAVCTSRTLTLPCTDNDDSHTVVQVIAPVADFVNHSFQQGPTPFVQLCGGELILRAVASVALDGQVVGPYYGAAGNDDLFVDAGMAVSENPYHSVELSLSTPSFRASQESTLKRLELDRFVRAGRPGHSLLSIMLRQGDPFPGVAIVLARILSGSEESESLQLNVSESTAGMDRKWVSSLLQVLTAHLQSYPQRDSAEHPADIVYNSTRAILKAAVSKLLSFSQMVK